MSVLLVLFPSVFAVDSCVLDRSCCSDTLLGFACVRNDTDSSIRNPIVMEDLANANKSTNFDEKGMAFLHYKGSPMYLERDGTMNFGLGLGRMRYAPYGAIFVKSATTVGSYGSAANYVWQPNRIIGAMETFAPLHVKVETETYPINEHTFLVRFRYQCLESANCTTPDKMPYLSTRPTGDYEVTYSDAIDGYSGFIIQLNASDAQGDDLEQTFYLAINETPDNYTITTGENQLRFSMLNGETKDFVAVFTLQPEYLNISDYLENPQSAIDLAEQNFESFYNMFEYPVSASVDEKTRYYNAIYNFWFNLFGEVDGGSSLWGDVDIIRPGAFYDGQWIWDSFFGAWMFAAACKDGASECFDIPRQWLTVFIDNKFGDGQWPREIWDNYVGAGFQAPGGWPFAIWQMHTRDPDTTYLCEVYPELKAYHEWVRDNQDSDADDLFTWGGTDSGWDSSARWGTPCCSSREALDLQGWMILGAESLSNIASVCAPSDVATWNTRIASYRSSAQSFWNGSGFYDLENDNHDDVLSAATYFMLLGNVSTSSQDSTVASFLTDPSILGSSDAEQIGILPTIARNDPAYDPNADTRTWSGSNWMNINLAAWLGLKRKGMTAEAALLKQGTLNQLELGQIGYEAYNADLGGKVTGGFGGWPYIWSDTAYIAMLLDWNPFASVNIPLSAPAISSPQNNSLLFNSTVVVSYVASGITNYDVYLDGVLQYSGILTTTTLTGVSDGIHEIIVEASNGTHAFNTTHVFTKITNDFVVSHPRLLFEKEDVSRILSNIVGTDYETKYDALLLSMNQEAWDDAWTLSSIVWTKPYYTMQLGLGYQLTNNTTFGNLGKEYLLGFAGYAASEWNDQSTHATTDAFWQLSLAYDFLYELLNESERSLVVDFFYNACVSNSGLDDDDTYYYYYDSGNGYGLRQGFGMCSLAIYGEHSLDPFLNATSTDYFNKFFSSADNYLAGYFNSSYALDGLSYQDYGMRHTVSYLAAHDRMFPENSLFSTYSDTLCGMNPYYVHSILDIDKPFSNDYIRRLDFSDMEYPYYPVHPSIHTYLAEHCDDPVAQWYLLTQKNLTDNYDTYSTQTSSEDIIWFNQSIPMMSPLEAGYSVSWKDAHNDYAIWRSGWTLTDDLVVSFKSDDDEKGHPQADDNMYTIHYKHELLTDSGYRTGNQEIPSSECYHNTLVVDGRCDMRWQDRGLTNPQFTRQLWGDLDFFNSSACTWPDCFYQDSGFRGEFLHYHVNTSYRAVQGMKPYFQLDNFTRYVVLVNATLPFIVVKDEVKSNILDHIYGINYVHIGSASVDSEELLIENQDSNLRIATVFNSSPYEYNLSYQSYQQTFRGKNEYKVVHSSSIDFIGDDEVFIQVMIPYLDSEVNPYSYTAYEVGAYYGVEVHTEDTNYSLLFDKNDIEEVHFFESSLEEVMLTFDTTGFDGDTTNMSTVNASAIANLCAEQSAFGKFFFFENVSVGRSLSFSDIFMLGPNVIGLNSTAYPEFNTTAQLSLYGLNFSDPIVLRDNEPCGDACSNLTYVNGTLTFIVEGFSIFNATDCGNNQCDIGETCEVCPECCVMNETNSSNSTNVTLPGNMTNTTNTTNSTNSTMNETNITMPGNMTNSTNTTTNSTMNQTNSSMNQTNTTIPNNTTNTTMNVTNSTNTTNTTIGNQTNTTMPINSTNSTNMTNTTDNETTTPNVSTPSSTSGGGGGGGGSSRSRRISSAQSNVIDDADTVDPPKIGLPFAGISSTRNDDSSESGEDSHDGKEIEEEGTHTNALALSGSSDTLGVEEGAIVEDNASSGPGNAITAFVVDGLEGSGSLGALLFFVGVVIVTLLLYTGIHRHHRHATPHLHTHEPLIGGHDKVHSFVHDAFHKGHTPENIEKHLKRNGIQDIAIQQAFVNIGIHMSLLSRMTTIERYVYEHYLRGYRKEHVKSHLVSTLGYHSDHVDLIYQNLHHKLPRKFWIRK